MNKTVFLTMASLALTACSLQGVNENTPMIAVGPKADRPGVFSGKDGKFTGTFNRDSESSGAATAGSPAAMPAASGTDSPASASQANGSVNVNADEYAEFKAWKDAREEAEFEAWKRQREREEFEAWKRQRDAQQ